MPKTSGVLVEESFQASYAPARRRRGTNSVFDRFSDFQAEAEVQRRELLGQSSSYSTAPLTGKRKQLEHLFRSPVEIMHHGNFETAKEAAVTNKYWLLLNIQDPCEFACQVLNRDVWKSPVVQELVKNNFIFWQVYYESSEGKRISSYYQIREFPFIGIIDPRTGELMASMRVDNPLCFCDRVTSFLEEHPSLDDSCSSWPHSDSPPDDNAESTETAIPASDRKRKSAPDAEQSTAAESYTHCSPRKALREGEAPASAANGHSSLSAGSIPKFSATVDHSVRLYPVDHRGTCKEDEHEILLRLPSGERRLICLPSSTKLKFLLAFVDNQLRFLTSEHRLVLNFPKRILNDMDGERSLQDLGIQKQETIFIEEW